MLRRLAFCWFVAFIPLFGCNSSKDEKPSAPAEPTLATVRQAAQSILQATPSGDTTLYAEAAKQHHNYGGHESFCAGFNPSANACGLRRGVVRFTLPTTPTNMSVYSATLTLTAVRGVVDTVNGTSFSVHRLLQSFG